MYNLAIDATNSAAKKCIINILAIFLIKFWKKLAISKYFLGVSFLVGYNFTGQKYGYKAIKV